MNIGIVNIGLGNIASVANAVSKIGMNPKIFDKPEQTINFDAIILPGVGAFPSAMHSLKELNFDEAIYDYVKTGKVLVGICLGMQLILSESDEIKKTKGLNLIPGQVKSLNNITNYEDMCFYQLRDVLYDLFIYDINVSESIWYIINDLESKGLLDNQKMSKTIKKSYEFFKYYNNNYRPIYHLENYILNIIKIVYEL